MAWNDNLQPGSSAHGIAASTHARIRVLAGPGAGKSFAMKRRVARILEIDQVDPTRVLAVTFTRVAAEDLHRELLSLGVAGADRLHGRTLHGLAMSILMRNHVFGALGRTPRLLNEFEQEPLLADLSRVHGKKNERKRRMRAYGAAWARLQTQQPGYARSPADQAFVDELVNWLKFHEAMLLDELIPHLYQYLSANPAAPERREYDHVLVDEYQDLNRAEQESLAFLGDAGATCIIGDDDQSIYSFRHAHPDGIQQWPVLAPTEEHAIAECRRCPTTVVRMANTLIARNGGRVGNRVMTEIPANGAGEVVVRQYDTADQEAEAVAVKIAALIQAGVQPGEIVVLTQRATFGTPIFERLRARNIPTKSYFAETELHTGEAQERFAMLKLFLDNDDRVALRWLLGYGANDWRAKPYSRLMAHIRANRGSPWAVLTDIIEGRLKLPHTTSIVARFREITAELANLAAAPDFDQFVTTWLPVRPETTLLTETVQKCRAGAESAQQLFDALYEAITRPEVPMEVAEVRVMSLHKSKGLSAPYVFIVGCVEGLHPAQPDPALSLNEQAAKLEEDRRLFYVGITRVKASPPGRLGYLALTHSRTMDAAAAFASQISPLRTVRDTAYLQASRFIAEMAPHVPATRLNAPL